MNVGAITIALLGGLLLLLAAGLEIGISIGVIAAIGLFIFTDQPLQQFIWTAFSTMNSFTLTAVPLFVFMGTLLANTGVVRTMLDGVDKFIGVLPGGLAMSVIAANAVFGAMSGSSVAAAATFGSITFPEMERKGYNAKLALGAIAMGGTLSVLIPPSIILIIYGQWQGESVAKLFAGAMIPGIILTVLLMVTVWVQIKLNTHLAPRPPSYGWRERLVAARELIPWVTLIVLVLGSIFTGIMTPTESSALGAFLGIVITLWYKKMSIKALRDSALSAVKISAMLALVTFTSMMLAHVFQFVGFIDSVSKFMLALPLGKYAILAVIYVMYLVLGMFFDAFAMLLLTLPFVAPIIGGLGFSFIWWGVVYVLLAEIGLVTPPFGLNLFALQNAVPKHSTMTIAAGALPFVVPALITMVLLTAFPNLVLWLPKLMY